jgi:thioredoxin-related protein
VKFNAEGNDTVNMYNRVFKNPDYHVNAQSKNAMHQFAKFMNINAYPTLIFLDENLQSITNLMGNFRQRIRTLP